MANVRLNLVVVLFKALSLPWYHSGLTPKWSLWKFWVSILRSPVLTRCWMCDHSHIAHGFTWLCKLIHLHLWPHASMYMCLLLSADSAHLKNVNFPLQAVPVSHSQCFVWIGLLSPLYFQQHTTEDQRWIHCNRDLEVKESRTIYYELDRNSYHV